MIEQKFAGYTRKICSNNFGQMKFKMRKGKTVIFTNRDKVILTLDIQKFFGIFITLSVRIAYF